MKDNYKNNNNAFFNNKNSFGPASTDESSDNAYQFKNIPMGLSMAFTQNPAAMTAFENMPEDKKRAVLEKASQVKSKKEMMSLVQDISINNL